MTAAPERPRFYGRRRGHKLRQGRQDLVEDLLPALRLPAAYPEGFQDIWLEVGFGAGEHLAAQAKAHPDIGFIGCEPFVNGVARLLALIRDDGLNNIRIFDDDARLLLGYLPEASVGRAFLLFSDPWPKARHHERRFVCPENLDSLARLLKDGAEFRFASDHMDYVNWALDLISRHPAFLWSARSPQDWRERPADGFPTRYEKKAVERGRACAYLTFQRRSRS